MEGQQSLGRLSGGGRCKVKVTMKVMADARRCPWVLSLLSMTLLAAGPWETASGQSAPTPGHEVVINEIHCDPDVKTELVEYVELHNAGPNDADISGWYFSEGISYRFGQGTILPAGGYLIVVQNPAAVLVKWSEARFGLRPELVRWPFAGQLDNQGEKIRLCNADGKVMDEVDYQVGFPWPTVGDPSPPDQPGTGFSMQLVNPLLDNNLGGSWRSAGPTPAARNKEVYAGNVPPYIRQVRHQPSQPVSGEAVTITAKVTDPDGVKTVSLLYQVVEAGAYIGLNDAQYRANWTPVDMHDDGLHGDQQAGDDIYTIQLPGSLQTHRRLVRYRILVTDKTGLSLTVPYADDPQPNFAYFVYDGVPAWRGAVQPSVTPAIEFPAEVMQGLPVYHLISKKSDVEDCTWLSKYAGSEYQWYGTLVYDGEVYDHIRYRARGGTWRYAMGKHMWKMDFQRGHYFQARDDYGNPYSTTWNKLNFSACIQQGSFGQRGEQGMFEAVSFRLFNLAGCPASKTNYVQFRIIDETYEDGTRNAAHPPLTSSGTQYDGDLWGLYMTIEQMDGRFLDEHGLPDGNLYKMDNSNHEQNNQGPTQPSNGSDLNQFLAYGGSESWWRQNVKLEAYYGYYAIYQAVHDGDITGKNWFLYHNPDTNQWWQLPWDKDLTWTTYYGNNDPSDPFSRAGVLNISSISMENKNRLREVTDLLFNTDQTNQLIDELAAVVNDPAGGLSMVDVDRSMWDYHWVVGTGAYPQYIDRDASVKAGQGRFYQEAVDRGYPRTFEGMVQVMKDYVVERTIYLDGKTADSAIPATPTVVATSAPAYPANALTFSVGPFSDPQGPQTFAALQWRIAEVEPFSQFVPSKPPDTVLVESQQPWRYFKGKSAPSSQPSAWRQIGFNDDPTQTLWLEGPTPIGFGKTFIQTVLSDMRNTYSTVYLRKVFVVKDLAAIGSLQLEARYDDGFVAWINGVRVASDNVAVSDPLYNSTASTSKEVSEFKAFPVADPKTVLKAGSNVLAVQVLNLSLANSDCYFDARLTAKPAAGGGQGGNGQGTRPVVVGRPGKYEIQPAWQGDPIPTFDGRVTIPAGAVEPGRTYRVRCRMKDDTGRWSHWSDPVQFTAGANIADAPRLPLQITEIMYNPPASMVEDGWEPDKFEFIELMNVGSAPIDLSGVRFVEGVAFDFAGSAVTQLGPGQFVLVVGDRLAFERRYGAALASRIAGQYDGKLSNSGERIRLVDLQTGLLADFEYNDKWYESTDGQGRSLVLVDPYQTHPNQLGQKASWRAGSLWGGSPGAVDTN